MTVSESDQPFATLRRRLRSHVDTLCGFDPPRCWGSPGLAAAGTWVRDALHAATGDSRVQAYDVVIGRRRGATSAKAEVPRLGERFPQYGR